MLRGKLRNSRDVFLFRTDDVPIDARADTVACAVRRQDHSWNTCAHSLDQGQIHRSEGLRAHRISEHVEFSKERCHVFLEADEAKGLPVIQRVGLTLQRFTMAPVANKKE